MHKNPAQLGFALNKEILDKILFFIAIRIKQLGQGMLINISPGTHHGKLKEAGHGRGHDIDRATVLFFNIN